MEIIGIPESLLPGSQAAMARQIQAHSVPNSEQYPSDFFVWDAAKLMTRVENSTTNTFAIPRRELESGHLGIAVQVLGGWPSERERNAADPPQAKFETLVRTKAGRRTF
jgi:hypothetical protein